MSKRRRGFAVGAFWQFASCVKVLRGGPLHQRCKNKGCEAFEGVRDPGLHQIDSRPVSPRPGESPIPRHQRGTERLRQSDVGGVVRREIRPQLPDAFQQRGVRTITALRASRE